jgi:hypothetical protein
MITKFERFRMENEDCSRSSSTNNGAHYYVCVTSGFEWQDYLQILAHG